MAVDDSPSDGNEGKEEERKMIIIIEAYDLMIDFEVELVEEVSETSVRNRMGERKMSD